MQFNELPIELLRLPNNYYELKVFTKQLVVVDWQYFTSMADACDYAKTVDYTNYECHIDEVRAERNHYNIHRFKGKFWREEV